VVHGHSDCRSFLSRAGNVEQRSHGWCLAAWCRSKTACETLAALLTLPSGRTLSRYADRVRMRDSEPLISCSLCNLAGGTVGSVMA
jgi:hypothetical protein